MKTLDASLNFFLGYIPSLLLMQRALTRPADLQREPISTQAHFSQLVECFKGSSGEKLRKSHTHKSFNLSSHSRQTLNYMYDFSSNKKTSIISIMPRLLRYILVNSLNIQLLFKLCAMFVFINSIPRFFSPKYSKVRSISLK